MQLSELSYNRNATFEGNGIEPGSIAVGLLSGDALVSPISGTIAALTNYEDSMVISIVAGAQVVDIFYMRPQIGAEMQSALQVGQQVQKGQVIGLPAKTAQSGRLYSIIRLKQNGIVVPYTSFNAGYVNTGYSEAPQISINAYNTPQQTPVNPYAGINAMAYIGADGSINYAPPTDGAGVPAAAPTDGSNPEGIKITPDGNSNVVWYALIGIVIIGLALALNNKRK